MGDSYLLMAGCVEYNGYERLKAYEVYVRILYGSP